MTYPLVGLVVGKRQSRPWIVSDELWALMEPLLPKPGPKLVEGRPSVPDRQALCGAERHARCQAQPIVRVQPTLGTTGYRAALTFPKHPHRPANWEVEVGLVATRAWIDDLLKQHG
ncbi:transposase [Streptomyces lydicus]|uniref:transposase n=1 Tax=Streptomyces lydicus TaxID=47763 RepID=UPI00101239E0|nr:transposase [Streptomyces lydicus]MCZ1006776.1 hypothetical protein [Streptomyces lydicus]